MEGLMVSKILDHLYLGDIHDARKFDGEIICVMQELVQALEPEHAYWIPIIRTNKPINDDHLIKGQDLKTTALKHQLDLVAKLIHELRLAGEDVLVHCMASIERSPLTIVYYLHKYHNINYNQAYDYVKKIHPITQNRLEWLNLTYDEYQS